MRYLLPLGVEGAGKIIHATLTPVAFGCNMTSVLTQVLFPTFAGLIAALDGWYPVLAIAIQAGLPLVVLLTGCLGC